MAEANRSSQGSVFISYSRKDKEFVKTLNDALDNAGVEAWVDWEGIELASDWSEACVYRAVDGTTAYCVTHENDINDAIFSKDGRYLITASADRAVKFWDALNGEPADIVNMDMGGAALDLDVSESVLAIAREDNFLTLYYFDKSDLVPVNVEQADGVKIVKFSPSGDFLAFSLQNGQVKFWQARNNFFFDGTRHTRSSYIVLAWSPDNLWLASGGGDSKARLIRRDGILQHEVQHQDWVKGVAFGPDPSWYVTVSDDKKVRVIDITTGTEKFRMSHTLLPKELLSVPTVNGSLPPGTPTLSASGMLFQAIKCWKSLWTPMAQPFLSIRMQPRSLLLMKMVM
jgi:WD40 repeat protein